MNLKNLLITATLLVILLFASCIKRVASGFMGSQSHNFPPNHYAVTNK